MAAKSQTEPDISYPGSSDADRLLRFIFAAGAAGQRLRGLLGKAIRAFDLSDAECLVLWLCSHDRPSARSSQQNLAAAIGVSPAQMSLLVERLRQRGLMEMKRSHIDRRRQVWHLLDQGEVLLGKIRQSLGTVARDLDALVPPADQDAAQSLLDCLAQGSGTDSSSLRIFDPASPKDLTAQSSPAAQGGCS